MICGACGTENRDDRRHQCGTGLPDVRRRHAEAAAEARTVIDGLGARVLGDLLDAALASGPTTAARTPRVVTTVTDSVTSPSAG